MRYMRCPSLRLCRPLRDQAQVAEANARVAELQQEVNKEFQLKVAATASRDAEMSQLRNALRQSWLSQVVEWEGGVGQGNRCRACGGCLFLCTKQSLLLLLLLLFPGHTHSATIAQSKYELWACLGVGDLVANLLTILLVLLPLLVHLLFLPSSSSSCSPFSHRSHRTNNISRARP